METVMSDLSRTCGPPANRQRAAWPVLSIAAAIRRLLRTAVLAIARELRTRRDTRRLLRAEPHILRDLGIVRSDVERLVRHGRDGR
jgi:uncharacterized protein YjiS (DUF1127 family)